MPLLSFPFQGLGSSSTSLSSFLFPVIRLSTDLKDPSSVYLLEDGLELWLAALHNTKTVSQGLMELADNLPALLGKWHLFDVTQSLYDREVT